MEQPERKILFDERGLRPGTAYEKGQWEKIATHSATEIKGFFGEYKFLSNFWPAKVFLDGEEYSTTENAYQAAKYESGSKAREHLRSCTPREAIVFVRDYPEGQATEEEWNSRKLQVMKDLLVQKFDKDLNPENFDTLLQTGSKYLEETNYWEDTYWGVHKTDMSEKGVGENNLGKLLMEIRDTIRTEVTESFSAKEA